ncbi:MAG: hypothetical protein PVI07_08975, partial [Anaerolineae bacterium]
MTGLGAIKRRPGQIQEMALRNPPFGWDGAAETNIVAARRRRVLVPDGTSHPLLIVVPCTAAHSADG